MRRSKRLSFAKDTKKEPTFGFKHFRNTHPSHKKDLEYVVALVRRQLPKMPHDYVQTLIFEEALGYRTLAITDETSSAPLSRKRSPSHIVGAIVYRFISNGKFIEIAYCCILTEFQGKGYGKRLMARFKQELIQKGSQCVMTYADNDAIAYFRKQGFCDGVPIAKRQWWNEIFHYDGGQIVSLDLRGYKPDVKRRTSASSFSAHYGIANPPSINTDHDFGSARRSSAASTARTPRLGWQQQLSETLSPVNKKTKRRRPLSNENNPKRKRSVSCTPQRNRRRVIQTSTTVMDNDSESESETSQFAATLTSTIGSSLIVSDTSESEYNSVSSSDAEQSFIEDSDDDDDDSNGVSSMESLDLAALPSVDRPEYIVSRVAINKHQEGFLSRRLRAKTKAVAIEAIDMTEKQILKIDQSSVAGIRITIRDTHSYNNGKHSFSKFTLDKIEAFVRFKKLQSYANADIILQICHSLHIGKPIATKIFNNIVNTPTNLAEIPYLPKCGQWLIIPEFEPRMGWDIRIFQFDHSDGYKLWHGNELYQLSQHTMSGGQPNMFDIFYRNTRKSTLKVGEWDPLASYVLPFNMEHLHISAREKHDPEMTFLSVHAYWFRLPVHVLDELLHRDHAQFRYCVDFRNQTFVTYYNDLLQRKENQTTSVSVAYGNRTAQIHSRGSPML